MDATTNSLNWFEIPVTDLARATKFYETVFDLKLALMEMPGMSSAMFPMAPASGKVNGCLSKSAMHEPAKSGCVIYLNANPDLATPLANVTKAGGTVDMPKTSIGPNGFMAFFIDTEGNRVGMHSNK
jgi:predicted enzyme related to lactoylglutathione lyase